MLTTLISAIYLRLIKNLQIILMLLTLLVKDYCMLLAQPCSSFCNVWLHRSKQYAAGFVGQGLLYVINPIFWILF